MRPSALYGEKDTITRVISQMLKSVLTKGEMTVQGPDNKLDFSNVTAAFFGCGDQVGYSDNFLDAIGLLAKPFMENGGNLIGRWPTEGYEFDLSLALDCD